MLSAGASALDTVEACAALLGHNTWATRYVPGFAWSVERAQNAPPLPAASWSRALEAQWSGPASAWLEETALDTWQRYWDRKYAWLEARVRAQRFKRREEIATNHLHDFQAYVLGEVRETIALLLDL